MSKEKQIDEIAKLICTFPQCINYNCIGGCKSGECQIADKAEALYNAGYRKQSGWISVKELLPDRATYVIVCDEVGMTGEAYHLGGGRFEWADDEERAFATHWMPLPEPPKMKGGE